MRKIHPALRRSICRVQTRPLTLDAPTDYELPSKPLECGSALRADAKLLRCGTRRKRRWRRNHGVGIQISIRFREDSRYAWANIFLLFAMRRLFQRYTESSGATPNRALVAPVRTPPQCDEQEGAYARVFPRAYFRLRPNTGTSMRRLFRIVGLNALVQRLHL